MSGPQEPYIPSANITSLNILNPYDDYKKDFISEELAQQLHKMLGECEQFDQNTETGHSVMTFGHPYHYVGSKNSPGLKTDMSGPLLDVVALLEEHFPHCGKINSCLVNRYSGENASLPKHADNEFSIDPMSSICTVSIGSKATA